MTASRGGRLARALLCLAIVAGVVCVVASATAPGKNGRIAFRRYFDAAHHAGAIFTITADGSGEQQVTHPPRGMYDDQPDWSPNGSLLVFSRCVPDTICAVYTVHPDGSGLKRISPACPGNTVPPKCEDDGNTSFLPDGKHVAFTRSHGNIKNVPGGNQIQHSDIMVTDLNGRSRRTVLRSGTYQADYNYAGYAPDGKRFVYEHFTSAIAKPRNQVALFVSSSNGAGDRRITPWALGAGDNPDWSPDGNWIVFRSHADSDTNSNIYKVHPDGSGLQQLTHFTANANVRSACFSPDGMSITVATDRGKGGNPAVYTMSADGTGLQQVTHSKLWDSAADWGSG
jgi:TolB protein